MIIDASVVLKGFFPDEMGHVQALALMQAYAQEAIGLLAPTMLPCEVTNAVLQAIRRGRITLERGQAIVAVFQELGIPTAEVAWQRALALARAYERSAYDGAYLALAEERSDKLITADLRLYNAVKDRLNWVIWIEEFAS